MPKNIHVAIVGHSGSGKTWLAQRIASAFGARAVYVTLDDFYRDLSHLAPDERSARNFDVPAAIDWDCVRSAMDALSSGEVAQVPNYDFATHTRRSLWRDVEPRDFVIWDGLWLLHEPWLRERFRFSIFVDCVVDERLSRRLARDVVERGRTPESVRRQFQEQVEPMGEQFVEPQRRWATCLICSPFSESTLNDLLKQIRATSSDATALEIS
jgi:uridine kinase